MDMKGDHVFSSRERWRVYYINKGTIKLTLTEITFNIKNIQNPQSTGH